MTKTKPSITVAVAIDSFKGSLSTFQAGNAAAEGILRACPDARVIVCPLADGGEGTVDAIIAAAGGERKEISVLSPVCRQDFSAITASYGVLPHRKTAVMEMAVAAGLPLVAEEFRNPMYTTTYGVGQMMGDAIRRGYRKFIIGIGGSATNDGGVGMLQALGFEFLNAEGKPISLGAVGLGELCEIRTDHALPELRECKFLVACDVKNPLCGENGCSAVYGSQKGASPEAILQMDGWLARYAELTKQVCPHADATFPGAGAAGGLGFALLSYLNATLQSGIDLVIRETDLESKLREADFVVTGEGRLDGQSAMGKAPIGVAKLAKTHGKPVIAFSGCVAQGAAACNTEGIDAFFPILRAPCTLEQAMDPQRAYANLADTAEQVFHLVAKLRNS